MANERELRRQPTRRDFNTGVLVYAIHTLFARRGPFSRLPRKSIKEPVPEAKNKAELSPSNLEVHVRNIPGQGPGEDLHDHTQTTTETQLSDEERIRLNAPVLTLLHTVVPGETLSTLATRYYDQELVEEKFAIRSLKAANASIPDFDRIPPGLKIRIPITEPVAVQIEASDPLAQAAKQYGFDLNTIQNTNKYVNRDEPVMSKVVYLPKQAKPLLKEGEQLYVTSSTDKNYFGVAEKYGYDLPTLLGRNRPEASNLQHGDILVTQHSSKTPKVDLPKPQEPDKKSGSTPTIDSQENKNVDQAIKDLKNKRTWIEKIDGSMQSALREQRITVEQLKRINLTQKGYKEFLKSINTEFAGVFEKAGTVHPAGILTHPLRFLWHHTAYGYKDGKEGVQQFIQGVINNRLSVQWVIDRKGIPYLLVKNPKQACNHAAPFNRESTGTEIMTDNTQAQGSLNDKQLEAALYLSYYVDTVVYGNKPDQVDNITVGHRELNDSEHAGTAGKPDFF